MALRAPRSQQKKSEKMHGPSGNGHGKLNGTSLHGGLLKKTNLLPIAHKGQPWWLPRSEDGPLDEFNTIDLNTPDNTHRVRSKLNGNNRSSDANTGHVNIQGPGVYQNTSSNASSNASSSQQRSRKRSHDNYNNGVNNYRMNNAGLQAEQEKRNKRARARDAYNLAKTQRESRVQAAEARGTVFTKTTLARHMATTHNSNRDIATSIIKHFQGRIPAHIDFFNFRNRIVRYVQMKKYVKGIPACPTKMYSVDGKRVSPMLTVFSDDTSNTPNYKTAGPIQKRDMNAVVNKKLGQGAYGTVYSVRGALRTWVSRVKFVVKENRDLEDFFTEANILENITKAVTNIKKPFINLPLFYGTRICDPDYVYTIPMPPAASHIEDAKHRIEYARMHGLRPPTGMLFAEKASGSLEDFLSSFHYDKTTRRIIPRSAIEVKAFNSKMKSVIMQCMLSLIKLRELGYYHNDAHPGNFLYHEVPAGGYIWYEVNGLDYFVKNEGMIIVPWDFGLSRKITYPLKANETSTVDFNHLVHFLCGNARKFYNMNSEMKETFAFLRCLFGTTSENYLGPNWVYLTHPFTQYALPNSDPKNPSLHDLCEGLHELKVKPVFDHDRAIFEVFKHLNGIDHNLSYNSPAMKQALQIMKDVAINHDPYIIKTSAVPLANLDAARVRSLALTYLHSSSKMRLLFERVDYDSSAWRPFMLPACAAPNAMFP